MDELNDAVGEPTGAGQDCPAQPLLAETDPNSNEIMVNGERLQFVQATADEQSAIHQMLAQPAAPPPRPVRSRMRTALRSAGLKLVGVLFLVTAVAGGMGAGSAKQSAGSARHHGGKFTRIVRAAQGARRRREGDDPTGGLCAQTAGASQGGNRAPECQLRAEACPHRLPDGQCRESSRECCLFASTADIRDMVAEMRQELLAVRQDYGEGQRARQRLEKMQAEKVFAFTDKIDPDSFRILCAILANGSVAQASRALGVADSTLRTRMATWPKRGPAYRVLGELVRWRKAMGRKGTVPLSEAITRGTAPATDYPDLLADVLDEVLAMNEENWQAHADNLEQLLRPHVSH